MALADLFTGIADAIRYKDGTTADIVATTFPERIRAIQSGGIQLQSIAITTPPTKTTYRPGETFLPVGMKVTATYSNGATAEVTGYTYSPDGPLAESDTSVTISYMESGVTKTAQQSVMVQTSVIVGVHWNAANSSTEMERLTVENDPSHLVNTNITAEPVPAVGSEPGSSPFDSLAPWNGMEEYNIIDGEVSYKYGDAGFSRSIYDTVVYIPEYWYKVIKDQDNWYFYVSSDAASGFEKHPGSGKYVGRYNTGSGYVSKTGMAPLVNITREAARTGSAGKGSKWCQYDFASWCAVEYLFRVEFSSWDSQGKVGRGCVDGTSAAIKSGGTDTMVYHTGRAVGEDGKTAVQYRHIENPWGNVYEWIDGINIGEKAPYICLDRTKFADDTETGYTNTGLTLPSGGYIKSIGLSNAFNWAFIPTESGGSETTYIPDYLYSSPGWKALAVSGHFGNTSLAGLWYFYTSSPSSYSGKDTGARLLYNP